MNYTISRTAFKSLAQEASMAASRTTDAHVAIVGAGPRGTSTLERLCASAREFLTPGSRLTVHIVDPCPPGAGRVWRTDQSQQLLMNTVSSQITLYTDDSVTCDGPIRPGPSLYEWGISAGGMPDLGPDEYPTRAFYGRYLGWVFAETVRHAPAGVEVVVHAARAVRLDDGPGGSQVLTLSTGESIYGLAAVMLALGHLPLLKGADELQLATHAARQGLRYVAPANPADVEPELAAVVPGEPVFLRGLGLNFFDYMALLTLGRGGRFVKDEASGQLRYVPSGNEPRLFAGSRRGIPYQSRGANQKGVDGRHEPLLLTGDVIAGFRMRAEAGSPPDFLGEVWPLVAKEVETVYYGLLLKQQGKFHSEEEHIKFQQRLLAAPSSSPQETKILDEYRVSAEHRWSWERLARPQGRRAFGSAGEWRAWLAAYLREDAAQAAQGNVDGPLKAALDVLRDLRNEVRLVVDHGGLSGPSRRDHLDAWYTPLNGFLSIGPPQQRIEQMAALLDAGVLDVLGPRPEVRATAGGWLVKSPHVPGPSVRVTALIEARLPEPDLARTADGLLSHLLRTGQCRAHTLSGGYETGGVDVTAAPYHVLDARGRAHPRRFAIGVPTEGVHWVTAAGIRPGVNSVTLGDSDAIARASLRIAVADGADGHDFDDTLLESALPVVGAAAAAAAGAVLQSQAVLRPMASFVQPATNSVKV